MATPQSANPDAPLTICGNANGIAVPVSGTVTAAGVAQGSTTSGQTGTLVQGAVTTAEPSYTNGQTSPLSLTTKGDLRIDVTSTTISGYETVAASQTAQALGATGATGDYLTGILVIPATTSPGNVLLLDNATSITVFAGGANSVTSLIPFFIPVGAISVSGAWKLTTGANVSCIGVGKFT